MAEDKPPCPCCADRLTAGPLFKLPSSKVEGICGVCIEAVSPEDADLLLASILAAAPVYLRWNLTPAQVEGLAAALERRSQAQIDSVVATHASGAALTWDNSMGVLDLEDAEFAVLESSVTFPGHVSTDKALRDACTEADTKLSKYAVESNARADLYAAVLAYSQTEEAAALEGERRRYVERRIREFKRVGLHLDAETAAQVKEINTKLSSLGIRYSKNLGEEAFATHFSEAQLAGLPSAFLAERKQTEGEHVGMCKVTLKYPCVIPILERCSVADTRKQVEFAYNSRCLVENTKILEELVVLRHQKALLMGYETHAEFMTEIRMSGGAAKVKSFLSELGAKLKPLLEQDVATLSELKAAEGAADPKIYGWDRSYYAKKIEETRFKIDHEELKKYFPLEVVTEGLLSIYQQLLGLTFEQDKVMEAAAWHADVLAFKVSDTESKELVGYFYMDMHPREGKYGHAACFGLQPACVRGATWQPPIAAAVCNFPKASAASPALLSHRDVETFFHEFGHVMHQLCSKASLSRFAGTRVERDFVEAPSQMLENWCWQPEALNRMSRHFETGDPIPAELLQALLASRNANSGILNMRQIVLASFDQEIHTSASADTAAVLAKLSDLLMSIPATPGTNMASAFGHMAGGYDAQYYGYMWSDVYSADMFETRFLKEGILSASTGASYRKEILEPGGSRDALESLVAFLGREPTQEAFLRSKGLAL